MPSYFPRTRHASSSGSSGPSSLPPLDTNLHLLSLMFKGLLVVLSPMCGWAILKLAVLIFNTPSYFILAWLILLTVGLVAEFLVEKTHTLVPTPGAALPTEVPQQQQEQVLTEGNNIPSPTLLFKSSVPKMRSSRSRSNSGSKKGFGKPVLMRLRLDEELSAHSSVDNMERQEQQTASKEWGLFGDEDLRRSNFVLNGNGIWENNVPGSGIAGKVELGTEATEEETRI